MDHSSKNKELQERYKALDQSNYKSLKMESVMTVLKRFWPNYKIKEAVNRRTGTSRNRKRKNGFKEQFFLNCSRRKYLQYSRQTAGDNKRAKHFKFCLQYSQTVFWTFLKASLCSES